MHSSSVSYDLYEENCTCILTIFCEESFMMLWPSLGSYLLKVKSSASSIKYVDRPSLGDQKKMSYCGLLLPSCLILSSIYMRVWWTTSVDVWRCHDKSCGCVGGLSWGPVLLGSSSICSFHLLEHKSFLLHSLQKTIDCEFKFWSNW